MTDNTPSDRDRSQNKEGDPKPGEAVSNNNDREAPLGELASRIDSRQKGRDQGSDELFDTVDVTSVDEAALWEEILSDTDADSGEQSVDPFDDLQTGTTPVQTAKDVASITDETAPVDDSVIVTKTRYCQQCEHFSAPPEAVCEYDGSEIIEVIGQTEFRVRNCPIVATRKDK